MTKPTPNQCRNGHDKIPENRTSAGKCKPCAVAWQRKTRQREREVNRLAKDRARTKKNLKLRSEVTTRDAISMENIRANKVFALMDQLELATTSRERQMIQSAIKELS